MSYYEKKEGQLHVETHGSWKKCAMCDRKPTKILDRWGDPLHCGEMYLCKEHFEMRKREVLREQMQVFRREGRQLEIGWRDI